MHLFSPLKVYKVLKKPLFCFGKQNYTLLIVDQTKHKMCQSLESGDKNKSVTDSAKPLKKENEKSKTKTKAPQTKAEKTMHEIFGNQVENDL